MVRKKSKFVIDTKLNIAEYIVTVRDIASAYFDDKCNFQPYIGDLNAMRIFYAVCVKDSPYEGTLLHEEDDLSKFEELFADEDFISAYNDAICFGAECIMLNFANAYNSAREMIETKKTSADRIINYLSYVVEDIANRISPTMSEDTLNKVMQISSDIKEGRISAQAVADAYSNTKRFEDVIEGKA